MARLGLSIVVKTLGKIFTERFRPYHERGEVFVDSLLKNLKEKYKR